MRDRLGVTAPFRSAPDFGGVNFVAVPGAPTPYGGYLNHPGSDPYTPPGPDPREGYIDPRLAGIDPRNRARAAQRLAQQQALAAAGSTATAQSLANLRALEAQLGGRGVPSAARGGYFRGPVRVHAGEMVQPTGDGGVEVIDPITTAERGHFGEPVLPPVGASPQRRPGDDGRIRGELGSLRLGHDDPPGSGLSLRGFRPSARQAAPFSGDVGRFAPKMYDERYQHPTPFNPDMGRESPEDMTTRLRAEYDAKVRAGVAAAQPVGEGRFREVAGRDSYSPSGRGGGGMVSHDEQMQGILNGSLHPDQASPEVRSAFMQRMQQDPRWARQVQSQWRTQANPQRPIAEQEAAAAQFKAESQAREAALSPEDRSARDLRREQSDMAARVRDVQQRSIDSRDRALRREALVADAPLEDVRSGAGIEPGSATINDVLFERARNRRAASQMPPGATPLDAQIGRRARTEQVAASRAQSQAQLIAAANRGTGRGEAAVDAARISAAGRALSSPDTSPEDKAIARSILAGGAGGAAQGGAQPSGEPTSPAPLPAVLRNAPGDVRTEVVNKLRLRPVANPDNPNDARWEFPINQDFQDLSNIENDWYFSDNPTKLGLYRSSMSRVADTMRQINGLEGEARAAAVDMLAQEFQRHGWGKTDWANVHIPGTKESGFDRIVKAKRRAQEILSQMAGGPVSEFEFSQLRHLTGGR